ncbi:PolC-type DNA polymerase III [Actinophytocola glycyrrhizae]|uniref:PolC-type DNA polymerase III n=1 Tax=Actinophytocola glycyrrhizae TaxID=2044873 RepID=A0ABV9SBV7_9PSEU
MTTPVPAALAERELIVVDVEGNGQTPPEIIEFAGLLIDGSNGADGAVRIEDMRSWLIRPQKPIASMVTRRVHGISNADVDGCPPWSQVALEIAELLGSRILVAHGAHVEYRVLGAHLPAWRPPLVLDTLRLAKHVWSDAASYSLDKLVEHARLDLTAVTGQRPHRAGYDTWCAWQLLVTLINDGALDWPGLVKVATLPGSTASTEPEGGLW